MNEFYHSFSIGFNYWYLLGPFQVILMVCLGASNAKLNKETNRIMTRDKKRVISGVFAVFMTIILMVAIISESSAGIIQVFDNHLGPEDDPIWSLFFFIVCMSILAVILYFIFYEAAILGKHFKIQRLRRIRRMRK